MKKHAGNVMAEMLADYGVTAVFGLPGGQTLPLYYGIMDEGDRIRHILMRDEVNASFAADAYARVTGGIGVCDATAGCGAIRFIPGLAEAYNTSIPVMAIAAEMETDWLAATYRGVGAQNVDAQSILKPVTKWHARLLEANQMPEMLQTAAQIATSGRPGPVYLECPWRKFKDEYTGPEYRANKKLANLPAHRPCPSASEVDEALKLISEAKRPVMLIGGGAWRSGAREEIIKIAEHFAMPGATSLTGKGVLPEDHALSLGVIGSLGDNKAAKEIVDKADVILAIGFKFSQNSSYGWSIPKEGQKEIRIDIDEAEINRMHTTDVGLVGDAKATLALMLERAGEPRGGAEIAKEISALKMEWQEEIRKQTELSDEIKPQRVTYLLNKLCDEDTILTTDASFACGWAGRFFDVYGNRRVIMPRGLAGLGYGLPAGVGAAAARPESPVVVLAGDGGFSYTLGELATIQEQNMNVKVVILNNGVLGWIKWYEAAIWDGRFTEVDSKKQLDFATVAKGLGCNAISITDPNTLEEQLKEALSAPGPMLIDITVTETDACKFTDDPKAVRYMEDDVARKRGE